MGEKLHGSETVAVVDHYIVGNVAHGVDHLLACGEINAVLTVVAELHGLADVPCSGVGLHHSQKHFDECGFTHAVMAYDSEFLVAGEHVVEIVENHFVAPAFGDMARLEYLRSDIGRGNGVEFHILLREVKAGAFLQVVERVDTVFGFAGACLGLTVHPLLLATQCVAHLCKLGAHSLDAFGASAQIFIVVTLIGEYAAAVYFDYFVAHAVKEIAVVCDHKQSHVLAREVAFEPFDDAYVEVVGRLVEHNQVGFLEYGACYGHAFALSAGKSIYRRVYIRDFELVKELLDAVVAVPCTEGVHTGHGRRTAVGIARREGFFVFGDGASGVGLRVDARFENGLSRSELGRLFHEPHAQAGAECD